MKIICFTLLLVAVALAKPGRRTPHGPPGPPRGPPGHPRGPPGFGPPGRGPPMCPCPHSSESGSSESGVDFEEDGDDSSSPIPFDEDEASTTDEPSSPLPIDIEGEEEIVVKRRARFPSDKRGHTKGNPRRGPHGHHRGPPGRHNLCPCPPPPPHGSGSGSGDIAFPTLPEFAYESSPGLPSGISLPPLQTGPQ